MGPRDTILVVDDTADGAEPLRAALTAAGYRVLVAPTVAAGRTILAAFVVRLVLINAPPPTDADAGARRAALERLADAARPTPLILYGGGDPVRYAAYAAPGYAAYLATPLDRDALVATVAGLLPAARAGSVVAHNPATAGEG